MPHTKPIQRGLIKRSSERIGWESLVVKLKQSKRNPREIQEQSKSNPREILEKSKRNPREILDRSLRAWSRGPGEECDASPRWSNWVQLKLSPTFTHWKGLQQAGKPSRWARTLSMQPPHPTYHPPPTLLHVKDHICRQWNSSMWESSTDHFFENICMLNMILDELLFASRTQTSKWLTLSLQIWRRYYSGGIPGDNRHWSNSLVGDPGKLLACRRNPMQPVPINISHLRYSFGQALKTWNYNQHSPPYFCCSLLNPRKYPNYFFRQFKPSQWKTVKVVIVTDFMKGNTKLDVWRQQFLEILHWFEVRHCQPRRYCSSSSLSGDEQWGCLSSSTNCTSCLVFPQSSGCRREKWEYSWADTSTRHQRWVEPVTSCISSPTRDPPSFK